jgi:hypothetical protein
MVTTLLQLGLSPTGLTENTERCEDVARKRGHSDLAEYFHSMAYVMDSKQQQHGHRWGHDEF